MVRVRLFRVSMRGLLAIVVMAAVGAWIGKVNRDNKRAARRAECIAHLNQIGIAIHHYHEIHGSFPPAYLADAQGKPTHSWRVLILPFLEQRELYAAYNFNEPWDGPGNSRLAARKPLVYECPNHRGVPLDSDYRATPYTSYAALVGASTVFPGAGTTTLADVLDGGSETLMLAEAADADIIWTEPRDLDADRLDFLVNGSNPSGISGRDGDGAHVLFVNGSHGWLDRATTPTVVKALSTRAGGEDVGRDRSE